MIRCVTNGQSRPIRYITPCCCTSRSQPSAGSQDGSSSDSHMPPLTNLRPGIVVRAASQATGSPSKSPSKAAAQLTHSELTSATAVAPVSAWCRYVSVNHCEPWSNNRGDTARIRKQTQGNRITAHRISQNSGIPSRVNRGRDGSHDGPRAAPPSAGGSRGVAPPGSYRYQRTMFESNQLLMVASCGPQVYGLMVWVLTDDSDGSEGSGLTPCSTG